MKGFLPVAQRRGQVMLKIGKQSFGFLFNWQAVVWFFLLRLLAILVSHTHTHTIDVIVDVRMTSCDVIVGIGITSLPVYAHTVCDTSLNSGSR